MSLVWHLRHDDKDGLDIHSEDGVLRMATHIVTLRVISDTSTTNCLSRKSPERL